jgi:hypothetical protein
MGSIGVMERTPAITAPVLSFWTKPHIPRIVKRPIENNLPAKKKRR